MRGLLPLLCLLLAPPAWAAPADPDGPLRPGDVVHVMVPGPAPLDERLTVEPDGAVALGAFGRVDVAGLTPLDAQRRLDAHLQAYLKDTAGVALALYKRGRMVWVTGQVRKPGLVALAITGGAWEAVHAAGGAAPGADLTRVVRLHGSDRQVLDLRAWLAGTATAPPAVLEAGDTLFVPADPAAAPSPGAAGAFLDAPALAHKVVVTGAVRNPGVYPRPADLDAVAALALAGGALPTGDLGAVRVAWGHGAERRDLVAVLKGAAARRPLPGQGVVVHVPVAGGQDPLSRAVNVLGEVRSPGRIAVAGPTRLLEVLARAGGNNSEGDLGEVRVLHEGPGYTLTTRYDVETVMVHGGPLARVNVHPGDTILVGRVTTLPPVLKEWVRMTADLVLLGGAVALLANR